MIGLISTPVEILCYSQKSQYFRKTSLLVRKNGRSPGGGLSILSWGNARTAKLSTPRGSPETHLRHPRKRRRVEINTNRREVTSILIVSVEIVEREAMPEILMNKALRILVAGDLPMTRKGRIGMIAVHRQTTTAHLHKAFEGLLLTTEGLHEMIVVVHHWMIVADIQTTEFPNDTHTIAATKDSQTTEDPKDTLTAEAT